MGDSLVPNEKRLAKLKTADFALFASNVSRYETKHPVGRKTRSVDQTLSLLTPVVGNWSLCQDKGEKTRLT